MVVRTKRWSREEYERLVGVGGFAPDARVQLIDGEIVEMTPQSAAHATALLRVQQALQRAVRPAHHLRAQLPLALGTRSEPEPDLSVVAGSIEDYRDQHPTTAVLVVEVADTTLEFDRSRKQGMYAEAGIPEYWIVNLVDDTLEVCREPKRDGYQSRRILTRRDTVDTVAATDTSLPVALLLR